MFIENFMLLWWDTTSFILSQPKWIFIFLTVLVMCLMFQLPKKNKSLDGIPGIKDPLLLPIILAYRTLRYGVRNTAEFLLQSMCGNTYLYKNGMFIFEVLNRKFLVLYNAESVEYILSSKEALQKGYEYTFTSDWLHEGLLTSTGEKWKQRRKLLTPAFHFRILEDFLPIFNEHAALLAKNLHQQMKTKQWVDISALTSLCTLDILCETAMGEKIHSLEDNSSPYVKAVHECCRAVVDRLFFVWLWPNFIYNRTKNAKHFQEQLKIMNNFTCKVINERKCKRLRQLTDQSFSEGHDNELTTPKSHQRLVFLDLLLDIHFKDPTFTLEDISEEVHSFMFAGHDTTSASLSFALYMLGLHPDIQKKVQQEVSQVLGDDVQCPVSSENLKELKYLDCVIKESRRLFPPVPFVSRTLPQDTVIKGYTIPKGTNCNVFIYMLHRDSNVYPNPEIFDPDRFLPENCSGRHPFAYTPFSAGPRNCIGQRFASMQLLILVATIVRHFDIKSKMPRDQIHIVPEIVTRSRDDLLLQFIPRISL